MPSPSCTFSARKNVLWGARSSGKDCTFQYEAKQDLNLPLGFNTLLFPFSSLDYVLFGLCLHHGIMYLTDCVAQTNTCGGGFPKRQRNLTSRRRKVWSLLQWRRSLRINLRRVTINLPRDRRDENQSFNSSSHDEATFLFSCTHCNELRFTCSAIIAKDSTHWA